MIALSLPCERFTLPVFFVVLFSSSSMALVVDSTSDISADDGLTTFREAVLAGGTVSFDSAVFSRPKKIDITKERITPSNPVTIEGPGVSRLTIQGDIRGQTMEIRNLAIEGELVIGQSSRVSFCRITGTKSTSGSYALRTMGLAHPDSVPVIEDCEVTGSGSGIDISSGGGRILRCVVHSNGRLGIAAGPQPALINQCEIRDNQEHGIVWVNSTNPHPESAIKNSTISHNQGGGLWVSHESWGAPESPEISITNCTISHNSSARTGAAIHVNSGLNYLDRGEPTGPSTLVLRSCTIVGNTSDELAGGVWVGLHSKVLVENCIFVDNKHDTTLSDLVWATTATPLISASGVNYSILSSTESALAAPGRALEHEFHPTGEHSVVSLESGTGNIIGKYGGFKRFRTGDIVGSLQDNGGPTRTQKPKPGSPAIDVGSGGGISESFDQRGSGYDRVHGEAIDIGAVECSDEPDHVINSVADSVSDDGLTTLREAWMAGGTVEFDPIVFATPQTIVLESDLEDPRDFEGKPNPTLVGIPNHVHIDLGGFQIEYPGSYAQRIQFSNGTIITHYATFLTCHFTDTALRPLGEDAHLTARNCLIEKSSIFSEYGTRLALIDSRIDRATGHGIDLHGRFQELILLRCQISNSAGIGVHYNEDFGHKAFIVDCDIWGSTGPAINISRGALTPEFEIRNCRIWNNGGGIAHSGYGRIIDCSIWGNAGSGIVGSGQGSFHVLNTTISGNTAKSPGGGVSIEIQNQRWYHIAWRYRDAEQAIFVDGRRIAANTKGPLNNAEEILVGTSKPDSSLTHWNDRDFQGWIDGVQVYAGALSDTHIASLADPSGIRDTDSDGQSDLDELTACTDPFDPTSVLRMLPPIQNNRRITLRWSAVPGKTYMFQASADLINWDDLGELTAGPDDLTAEFPVEATLPFTAFRVKTGK